MAETEISQVLFCETAFHYRQVDHDRKYFKKS